MRSRYSHIAWSGALSLLLAVMTGLAQADQKPLPRNSHAFGEGYSELTADWLEWVLAIPTAANPLLDLNGASAAVGQSGKVWFLVGNTTGGATTRTVIVPAGKALFFPIVNYFWVNTPEFGDAAWSPAQEAFVRQQIAAVVDTAYNLFLEIDGQPVPNVAGLRVSGAVGACTLPADNIFGVPLAPGPHECVADGYWALLPPLPNGHHTIRFGGMFNNGSGFSLDVRYHITVRGR